jgi:hemoglobin/transferrin/lactoferrin receptor protein
MQPLVHRCVGHHPGRQETQTGVGLYSIAPQKITTAGVRLFENQAIFSVMWTSVKGNTDIPAN